MEENNKNKKYPNEGDKWLKKNMFGRLEPVDEQCDNETCNCAFDECLYEEYLWEEYYMYQAYKKNMLAAQRKKNEEGDQ